MQGVAGAFSDSRSTGEAEELGLFWSKVDPHSPSESPEIFTHTPERPSHPCPSRNKSLESALGFCSGTPGFLVDSSGLYVLRDSVVNNPGRC